MLSRRGGRRGLGANPHPRSRSPESSLDCCRRLHRTALLGVLMTIGSVFTRHACVRRACIGTPIAVSECRSSSLAPPDLCVLVFACLLPFVSFKIVGMKGIYLPASATQYPIQLAPLNGAQLPNPNPLLAASILLRGTASIVILIA